MGTSYGPLKGSELWAPVLEVAYNCVKTGSYDSEVGLGLSSGRFWVVVR